MSAPIVHRRMRVIEIASLCPAAVDVMAAYGLHCVGCSVGGLETLEEGCRIHGYGDAEIDTLVADLNETAAAAPARPQHLTLTQAAAKGIRSIAESEGRTGQGLAVIVDESGNFCMEFRKDPDEGDVSFHHEEEPDVCIYASPITLSRIGGSTIDMREGRFKLDLPETCACDEQGCTCNPVDRG